MGLREERACGLRAGESPLAVPCCCADELTHFCCTPCALIQERKVLVKNRAFGFVSVRFFRACGRALFRACGRSPFRACGRAPFRACGRAPYRAFGC